MNIYKPFEKRLCPVKKAQEELDPIHGISIDGVASLLRRDEIKLEGPPYALHPEVGFETRFHKVKLCNFTFTPLHYKYTNGTHLVNFIEELRFLRNMASTSPTFNREEFRKNHSFKFKTFKDDWFEDSIFSNVYQSFTRSTIKDLVLHYDEEDKTYQFTYQCKVNSEYFLASHVTAVGSVVQVLDSFENKIKPCEVPIRFRDLDRIYTERITMAGTQLNANSLKEKFNLEFDSEELALNCAAESIKNGNGFLAAVKSNPDIFSKRSLPQLQLTV